MASLLACAGINAWSENSSRPSCPSCPHLHRHSINFASPGCCRCLLSPPLLPLRCNDRLHAIMRSWMTACAVLAIRQRLCVRTCGHKARRDDSGLQAATQQHPRQNKMPARCIVFGRSGSSPSLLFLLLASLFLAALFFASLSRLFLAAFVVSGGGRHVIIAVLDCRVQVCTRLGKKTQDTEIGFHASACSA